MIEITKRKNDEIKKFREVFGVSIDSVTSCKIFIQEDCLSGRYSPEEDGRVISIFCRDFATLVYPQQELSVDIEKIFIRRGNYSVCRDIKPPIRDAIIKIYKDEFGYDIAVVDCYGNIYFIDFIHYISEGKNFLPVFFEILKQENHPLVNEWWELFCEQEISKIIYPEIVKAVKTLGIARKAKTVIEGELQSQYGTQISILAEEIKRLKQEEAKRAEKEIWGAFLVGVELADGKLWKVNNGLLEYKKKIFVKHIKEGNKIVDAPKGKYYVDGLTIKYSQDELIRAWACSWYHPNISDSGSVCLGDVRSSDGLLEHLKRVQMLPQILQTINLDSSYDGQAKSDALDDFERAPKVNSEVFDLTITTD